MKKVSLVVLLTAIISFIILVPEGNTQKESVTPEGTVSSSGESKEKPEDPTDYSRAELIYNSLGKRDPFQSLVPGTGDEEKKIKGLFDYEGGTLKGIINTEDDSYALVVDADGFGHILREGYRVSGGYVTNITDNAVYLHIVKYGRSLSIIIRLESSKSSVIVEKEQGESIVQKPGINITYSQEIQSRPKITVEDVIIPSLEIKTIEEEWFGPEEATPVTDNPETGDSSQKGPGSFSLIDPFNNSWIALPYVFDWTIWEGKGVSYILIIDDDSDFSSPLLSKENIRSSSFLLGEDTGLPPNTKLFWKIVAQDESGTRVTSRRTDMSFKIIGKQ